MAIPQRERRDHKCLRSSAHINSYGFQRAMHPTPQQPHRRVPTSPHSTTDDRPNRSTDPGAKLAHTNDRAHCSDARTTVRQAPYAGTYHGRQGPGRHHHSPPQRTARITLIYPLTHRPTPSRRGHHSVNPITTHTRTPLTRRPQRKQS